VGDGQAGFREALRHDQGQPVIPPAHVDVVLGWCEELEEKVEGHER
jgi:hypothetical protein